jgi:hypothetical protein
MPPVWSRLGMTAVCWLAYLVGRHFAADGDGSDLAQ